MTDWLLLIFLALMSVVSLVVLHIAIYVFAVGGNILGGERCILVIHDRDCSVGKGDRRDRTFL